jgi:hypothetical protein
MTMILRVIMTSINSVKCTNSSEMIHPSLQSICDRKLEKYLFEIDVKIVIVTQNCCRNIFCVLSQEYKTIFRYFGELCNADPTFGGSFKL